MTATSPAGAGLQASAPQQRRVQRLRPPLLLAAGILVASVALHFRDPHRSGSWGYCPWYLLTGTYCPGCGGLRAVNDLTRGDVAGAASSNLLFVTSLPFVGLLWARSVRQRWTGVRRPLPPRVLAVVTVTGVALALGFAVLRNLPFAAWLTP